MSSTNGIRFSEARAAVREQRRDLRSDRREIREEDRSDRREQRVEQRLDRREQRVERRENRRRRIQDEITNPTPPANPSPGTTTPSNPPVSTSPTAPTTPTVAPSNDLKSLATRYVDGYSKQAGRTLSSDERSSLIRDVEDFYDDPQRAGRLQTLVNEIA